MRLGGRQTYEAGDTPARLVARSPARCRAFTSRASSARSPWDTPGAAEASQPHPAWVPPTARACQGTRHRFAPRSALVQVLVLAVVLQRRHMQDQDQD